MFTTNLANDYITWLIQRFRRDFKAILIGPESLCRIEINPVFFTIDVTLL